MGSRAVSTWSEREATTASLVVPSLLATSVASTVPTSSISRVERRILGWMPARCRVFSTVAAGGGHAGGRGMQ
jgi:hypothetical protein